MEATKRDLERTVKLRSTTRKAFTRQLNILKGEISDTGAEAEEKKRNVQVSLSLLRKKNEELLKMDNKILDLKIDVGEEDLDGEVNLADDYQRQFLETEVSATNLLTSRGTSPDDGSDCTSVDLANKRKFKLPKLELRKFDGNLKQWLQFWGQFSKIDKDPDIAPEDKFQYLLQATVKGSRAREIVESFPPAGENYGKAVECLKSRFGRDDLLVEVYVRELLTIVLKNASTPCDLSSMCVLYDNLESHIRSLETLGVTTDKCASMLYPLVESCLPEESLRAWQRSSNFIHTGDSKDRLDNLMIFLKSEVEAEERISLAISGFGFKESNSSKEQYKLSEQIATAADLLNTNPAGEKRECCIFCEGKHDSSNCFKAQKLNLPEKQRFLKEKGGCFKCFKRGHCASKCKSIVRCIVCGKSHSVLMCPELSQNKKQTSNNGNTGEHRQSREKEEQKTNSLSNISKSPKVLLQTLMVKIKGSSSSFSARALIDSGSQRSYVRKDIVHKLGYTPLRTETMRHGLFGGVRTNFDEHSCYQLEIESQDGKYHCNFEVLDQTVICDGIPSVKKGPWLNELQESNISITDISENSGPVDLLIGADVAGRLMTGNIKVLSSGLVAVETHLGWTLMGKVPQQSSASLAVEVTALFVNEINDLWSLDAIGISDSATKLTKDDRQRQIREDFQRGVTVNVEGRYEVSLLWKEDHLPIPSNRELAIKRLESTNRKLQSQNLVRLYDTVLNEWIELGIIEEVPMNEVGEYGHYLPHRAVIKDNSTTKIRPVFDASARERNSPSLNHCLECGPNLIEQIPSLLLKFRERMFGVIADIEKAFLQISVRPEDRDFLRFFWYDSDDMKSIRILRHRRVVFGLKCSPFLLGAVLDYHLSKAVEEGRYSQKHLLRLKQSLYVDNVVTSVDSEQELKEFIGEARDVMMEGKFNLRGWQANNDIFTLMGHTAVLGLQWDLESDTLFLNLEWLENFVLDKVTKRSILSIAQRVFDPIGLASPVLLIPKLLLQKIWSSGMSWDEEVSDDLKTQFVAWYSSLSFLKEMKIPRWFHFSENIMNVSLHTFCDASTQAYAAVVFIRLDFNGTIKVHLLSARARVAPLKAVTIPRLELIAATVGARLGNSVLSGLSYQNVELYFWTDSTTTLTWIQKDEAWTVFVSNRVKEIRRLTLPEMWRYVPGPLNPADLPSRGCQADRLLALRWWEGPEWLRKTQEEWPCENTAVDAELVVQEKRKSTQTMTCLVDKSSNCDWCSLPKEVPNDHCKSHGLGWYSRYFSNYDRIVRMIAWVERFIHNSRNVELKRTGELSCEEIILAGKVVIRLIQQESFSSDDINYLSNLKVFQDEEGILRVKTRLVNRQDNEYFCMPMILPSSHPVVHRLIMSEHIKNSHVGTQTLLNVLREQFWILKARKTIRSVLSKCVICLRHVGRSLNAPYAPLPKDRVKDSAVFEVIGVDLAGPLYLRGGGKAWICLFTCAVYRAVHLELLSSLSSESFLQGLRRFIARRGRPLIIYSDNGTNFVGTSNDLKSVDWEKIVQYSNLKKIEWKFIPPSAPWWGGFWERLVGVMKQILRKVLSKALLTYEEMTTVLCDTESLINSRPLTYVSDSDCKLLPLSPALFLHDVRETGVSDCDTVCENSLNKRLRYRQKLMNDLRKRFRSEYLGLLVQRSESKKVESQVKLGDIVIIGSDHTKRMDWPLGRVVEIIPGTDNVTRLVRLKTATSTLLRPIQRLYPLEVSSDWVESVKVPIKPEHLPEPPTPSLREGMPRETTRSGRTVRIPERLDL